MKSSDSVAISEESLMECVTFVRTLTKRYGVAGGKPGHFIDQWEEEMNRMIFELSHGSSNQHRRVNDRRKYISVFKARYLQVHDWEYPADVSPMDIKCIDSLIDKILEKSFSIDEYLAWYFEVYIPDNPKMAPETIAKSACAYCFAAFMCANGAKIQQNKESQKENAELLNVIERAKVLIRESKTPEIADKTKEVIKNFREKRIILIEFRQQIDALEKQGQ